MSLISAILIICILIHFGSLVVMENINYFTLLRHVRYHFDRELASVPKHVLDDILLHDGNWPHDVLVVLLLLVEVAKRKLESFGFKDIFFVSFISSHWLHLRVSEACVSKGCADDWNFICFQRGWVQGIRIQEFFHPIVGVKVHFLVFKWLNT